MTLGSYYCMVCGTELEDCGHTNAGNYHKKSMGCPNCGERYEMDSRRTPEWEPMQPFTTPQCWQLVKDCQFKGATIKAEDYLRLRAAIETFHEKESEAKKEYKQKLKEAKQRLEDAWEEIAARDCRMDCIRRN